jgi:dimethylhistidine N-methyltransferase
VKNQNHPAIFSDKHRHFWRQAEDSIWTSNSRAGGHDEASSVLRTLLDQPRWLAPYHLYDDTGSQLFDRICDLPEYYLTRTESAILKQCAGEIIRAARPECIVELGAGTSQKTLLLLEEQLRQGKRGTFAPIDVSLASLRIARDNVKKTFPQLGFHGLHGKYEDGIAGIEKSLPALFVFLGSTVGNFDHSQFAGFFRHLSESMGPEDFFLLGADRVKDTRLLENAYHDSQGLTAEFILNVFENVNRILGGNFDRKKMRYHSWYNPEWQRIEMYAESTARQEIIFPSYETSFVWEQGERILVEISRKFHPDRLQEQLRCFGLDPVAHFTDPQKWFSLLLFQKAA